MVYFEVFPYVSNTIPREKEIKGWGRAQPVALIERETSRGTIYLRTAENLSNY
jgi:predicted GIY-YIG superfamily endonuclease